MNKILFCYLLSIYRCCWINPVRRIKFSFVHNYKELYFVALWEIKQLSRFGKVSMVSAPLFSGGTGNFHPNVKILKAYIEHISSEGEIVWSQIPYLDVNIRRWANIQIDTSKKISEFYVPLIGSKKLTKLIFIPEKMGMCTFQTEVLMKLIFLFL